MGVIGRLAAARRCPTWFGSAGVRQRLRDGRRGTAAVEFALLFPVMVALMFGMTDACLGLVNYRRVTVAAEETALIATELSVQPDNTLQLTPTTSPSSLYVAATAIFGVIPGLKSAGATQPFSVTVSDIVFVGTPSGCTPSITVASGTLYPCTSYTANVAWSVPLSTFTGQVAAGTYLGLTTPSVPLRQCGLVSQVAQSQAATFTSIPTAGMTNLSSVLVVDVTFRYQPLFTQVFVGPQTFMHTALLPPRLTPPSADDQYIDYVTATGTPPTKASAWTATAGGVCSGYN